MEPAEGSKKDGAKQDGEKNRREREQEAAVTCLGTRNRRQDPTSRDRASATALW